MLVVASAGVDQVSRRARASWRARLESSPMRARSWALIASPAMVATRSMHHAIKKRPPMLGGDATQHLHDGQAVADQDQHALQRRDPWAARAGAYPHASEIATEHTDSGSARYSPPVTLP